MDVATDGTIYVADFDAGTLLALSIDGELEWSYAAGGSIYSSPAVGADGSVFVGAFDASLHAVNPDGSPRWSAPTNGPVVSSPAVGSDGSVYVASLAGTTYAIESAAGGLSPSVWPMFGRSPVHDRALVDPDTDGDGIRDSWEQFYASAGLDFLDDSDAALDPDRDTATNLAEFLAGTSPEVPNDPLTGEVLDILIGDVAPLGAPDGLLNLGDTVVEGRLLAEPALLGTLGPTEQVITNIASDVDEDGALGTNDLLLLIRSLTE